MDKWNSTAINNHSYYFSRILKKRSRNFVACFFRPKSFVTPRWAMIGKNLKACKSFIEKSTITKLEVFELIFDLSYCLTSGLQLGIESSGDFNSVHSKHLVGIGISSKTFDSLIAANFETNIRQLE